MKYPVYPVSIRGLDYLAKWHCNMILHLRIIIIKAIIERCYLLLLLKVRVIY